MMNEKHKQELAELDQALEQLIAAAVRYAEAIRTHGELPTSHTGKIQQIAHLVDNWQHNYSESRENGNLF